MTRSLSVLTLSHLYPSSAHPGLGPFVRDEVLELAKRHEFRVISPIRVPQRNLSLARQVLATPRDAMEDGVRVMRPRVVEPPVGGLRTAGWLWAVRLHGLLGRTYREMQADLLHAHFAIPDGFAAARFASSEHVPLVLTVRGSDVLVFSRQTGGRRLLMATLAQAHAIIAVSEELADRVRELGAPPELVHVIPGGVPYDSTLDRQVARQLLGIPEEDVCILWVGRFVNVKQPIDALEAFCSVCRGAGGRRVRLVMLGEGPLLRGVADRVVAESIAATVQLVGQVARADVWTWLCAADILLNSSSSEGTPISVLEALGAGTPIVAYPLPGVRAVVDAVSGGTIAAGTTPQDLAMAIDAELSTGRDRNRLGEAARRRFDITGAAGAIEDVYAGLV